jgi:hypothetical protein
LPQSIDERSADGCCVDCAARQAYIQDCHDRKALECHYLEPMLAESRVALNDDILFPNHIQALGTCFRRLPHLRRLCLKACGMDDARAAAQSTGFRFILF